MTISDLVQALIDALSKLLSTIPTDVAEGAQIVVGWFITWLRNSSGNFITHTPSNLVNVLSNLIGINQVAPLLNALTGTAILFAAVSYAGHYLFGWPGIGESLQRIGVAIILVKSSWALTDWSLSMMDSMSLGLAQSLPDFPALQVFNDTPAGMGAIVVAVLMILWALILLRLVFAAAQRIIWLALLKPIAGLAFLTFLHPKSAWIGNMWVRLWVGWLVGQFMATLAVGLSVVFVSVGGGTGFVLSCAALWVAADAMRILAPNDSLPSIGAVVRLIRQ